MAADKMSVPSATTVCKATADTFEYRLPAAGLLELEGDWVSVAEIAPRNDDFERTPPHDVVVPRRDLGDAHPVPFQFE